MTRFLEQFLVQNQQVRDKINKLGLRSSFSHNFLSFWSYTFILKPQIHKNSSFGISRNLKNLTWISESDSGSTSESSFITTLWVLKNAPLLPGVAKQGLFRYIYANLQTARITLISRFLRD